MNKLGLRREMAARCLSIWCTSRDLWPPAPWRLPPGCCWRFEFATLLGFGSWPPVSGSAQLRLDEAWAALSGRAAVDCWPAPLLALRLSAPWWLAHRRGAGAVWRADAGAAAANRWPTAYSGRVWRRGGGVCWRCCWAWRCGGRCRALLAAAAVSALLLALAWCDWQGGCWRHLAAADRWHVVHRLLWRADRSLLLSLLAPDSLAAADGVLADWRCFSQLLAADLSALLLAALARCA